MEEMRNVDRKVMGMGSCTWVEKSRNVMTVVKPMQKKKIRHNRDCQRYVWEDLAAGWLSMSWGEFYCQTII